jgi:catechol 2,3-dioxygenase-like lactoylglutathione lyase family enzyme
MNAPSEHATGTTGVMQAATFHGVRYLVADVKRASDFYTTRLGFNLEHQQLPAFATVALGPLKILLSGPGHRDRDPCRAASSRVPAARTAWFFE